MCVGTALVTALLTGLSGLSAHAADPSDRTGSTDPATLVDPFAGTGSGGGVVGDVDTFPGASAPFGMVQFSPDTP
ncbi:MAG TPA: hypothetical protein VEO01_06290, partial [Pseudonocardiaceae bacterium]|nr:hypothetical protein [Pseudonocardiaceae bacterium]